MNDLEEPPRLTEGDIPEAKNPLGWMRKLPSTRLRFAVAVLLFALTGLAVLWELLKKHAWLRRTMYAGLAAFGVWSIAALAAGELIRQKQVALDVRGAELRKVATNLPAQQPNGLLPLPEACAGKLVAGPVTSLIATAAPFVGAEEGWDPPLPIGHLLGSRGWNATYEPGHSYRHDNAFEAWPKMMKEGPFLLSRAVWASDRARPDVLSARYLAVIHLQAPVPSAQAVAVSVVDLRTQSILEAPKVLCTGQVTPSSGEKGDVLAAPVYALCKFIGQALCDALDRGGVVRH